MTDHRVFLYVIDHAGRLRFYKFHDYPPGALVLRCMGGAVVYRQELSGRWAEMSLDELEKVYRDRAARGTLPPDNMVEPKGAPAEKLRPSWDIPERTWFSDEEAAKAKAAREAKGE